MCEGIGGFKKRDKGRGFASQAHNCKQTVIQVSLVSILNKKKFINSIKLFCKF